MAKAEKPAHVLQHAGPVPKIAPAHPKNSNKPGSPRKRMAKRGRWDEQVENMTEIRWRKVIAAIANGATRAEAAKSAKISPMTIDAYLISNITAYKQLRDAVLTSNRRAWPIDLIEQIFDDLAMGDTLKGAAEKRGITDKNRLSQLYRIVRKDKAIRDMYDEARELQAESFVDDIIDIADDSGKDRLENGRINHEVVNRSKLKIDTRRFVMGAMVKKRFGDHKHVELEGNLQMNHVAMLTGARRRLEDSKTKPAAKSKTDPATIENDTQQIVGEA
jgi:hypothetical protein